jgi:DNA-binding CsgD family transcriptional regulator
MQQNHGTPKIAIIDPNTLAVLGLKSLLQNVMPIVQVDTYGSYVELEANHPEQYFHYFVSMNIVLQNRSYFTEFQYKTIVLTLSIDTNTQLSGFNCLCVNVPEKQLIKSLLALQQRAHSHGRNLPPMPRQNILSDREIEVMSLIVMGYINKEIADKLNIGLPTVITHRKNIMDKLNIKSVSAMTIYAVMNGYVDINKI